MESKKDEKSNTPSLPQKKEVEGVKAAAPQSNKRKLQQGNEVQGTKKSRNLSDKIKEGK